jgi:hypothetical protein
MERAAISLLLVILCIDSLIDAIVAVPPYAWFPAWLWVVGAAFAVRVWRHGIA